MKLRIRDLREDRDLTQKEVAAYLHCDQSLYSKYERGERLLPLDRAVQLADYFILHRDRRGAALDVRNAVIWAIGFVVYRLLMQLDLPVGNTLPDMLITIALCLIANAVLKNKD